MGTAQRWDVCTPRKKHNQEGSWWLRVGVALQSDRGQITVYLDAVPLPDPESNQIKLMLFEPKEREGVAKASPKSAAAGRRDDIDDEIPF